ARGCDRWRATRAGRPSCERWDSETAVIGLGYTPPHEKTDQETREESGEEVRRAQDPAHEDAGASKAVDASKLIDGRIRELGDWRGKTLERVRRLIHETDPDVVEEWKWMGTPVWSHGGIVCTGESYKQVVKLTFAKGASLRDP